MMKKAAVTALFTLMLSALLTVPAFAQELMVGGQVVGVQISTKGVVVAGLSEVETGSGTRSPAKDAGVQAGDIIIKADGVAISKASELTEAVERLGGECVTLTVLRGDKPMGISVQPVKSAEGQWLLGMWLRDGISGIGTMTFCDPESGIYGALGHSVNDVQTGRQVPVGDGSISEAQIVSITPGVAGDPGELNGCADLGRVIGSIELNTEFGIYGKLYTGLLGRTLESGVIAPGPATIVSTLSGRETGEYEVEINRVYKEADGVHAMLTVTDPALIAKTGGIVQGMSGSPIIQGGRLVGAVTHVFVSEPSRGYAISIQDMLVAAGLEEKAA